MGENKHIVYDPWLTQILGRNTYKLIVDEALATKSPNDDPVLRELQSQPVFIYTKVPAESLLAVKFLERTGFHLVETNVVFDKPIISAQPLAGHCAVRFAVPEDKSQVVELARNSFVYSRFHLDKAIPPGVANTIKAEWVGSYFAGKRGDNMVVALVDERIVGFLLILYGSNGILIIDLIAVDENQRRKGIAGDMIVYAESQCRGCSRIMVGTQVANTPSIRFYEKRGFRMCAAHYVFHYNHFVEQEK